MEQTQSVPPQRILVANVRPGRNPRRYFDPSLMADLENSIRAHGGLLQPILVRPVEANQFEIVAGERRFRAYKAVYGDQAEIPALMREMTDDEAAAAALAENTDRTSMTPVEESEAAARVLGDCQNNRDEAAARLGWSRPTLDKRLALMYATDKVRDLARVVGINTGRANASMWCLVGAVCGIAGLLVGLKTLVSPEAGAELLLVAFAAAVVGGLGNPLGAVAGAVLLGVFQELSTPFVGFTYKIALSYVVMLLVLLWRPQGLFNRLQGAR